MNNATMTMLGKTRLGAAIALLLGAGIMLATLSAQTASVPAAQSGWGRDYALIASEPFASAIRIPSKGFVVDSIGTFPTTGDDPWITGFSDGTKGYQAYYRTEPSQLPIPPNREYEMSFDYRIDQEPDKGAEAMFYSPLAGNDNDWAAVVNLKGKKGTTGHQKIKLKLKNYPDYQLRWNIPNKGKMAIRNILLVDTATGKTVAREFLDTVTFGPGKGITVSGNEWSGGLGFSLKKGSAVVTGPAYIRTVPSVIPLPPDTPIIMEFDWKARRLDARAQEFGSFSLYAASDPAHRRGEGSRIDGYFETAGHFTGGLKTGKAAVPYVFEVTIRDGVEFTISNLTVSRQIPVPRDAGANPALKLAEALFPRIGGYQAGKPQWMAWDGSGTVKENLPWVSMAELDRRNALYDAIMGFDSSTSSEDPAFGLRLRRLNPDIVLLPYAIAQEALYAKEIIAQFGNPLLDASAEFSRGLDDSWFLRDSSGALAGDTSYDNIRKMDISPFCPKDSKGRTFLDYYVEQVIALYLKDGTWDGQGMDNLFACTNPHFKNLWDTKLFDVDYNRNGARDDTIEAANDMTAAAMVKMLTALRGRFGDSELIMGNVGARGEPLLAPYVNGFSFEAFNYPWYPKGDSTVFSEAAWSNTLVEYRRMERETRKPTVLIMEALGFHGSGSEVHAQKSYRSPTAEDIRIQRIAVGTALLGDGFYEYDLYDNRSVPFFFDEQLVGRNGVSTDTEDGKGWLGAPLGPAVELVTEATILSSKGDEYTVTKEAGKELFMGANKTERTLQFILEFDWEILDTQTHEPVINVSRGDMKVDYTPINGIHKGLKGSMRMHTTVAPGAPISYQLYVTGPGRVRIKNIKVTSAHSALFRRDFQNGVVFVNASKEDRIINYKDLAGTLNRTGLIRILGKLDTVTNNGKPVDGPLFLGAADAIVLRANHLER